MTTKGELNHEKNFQKLALEIDFVTIGKWINKIPEEKIYKRILENLRYRYLVT